MDNLWRKARALLNGGGPCPHCGGKGDPRIRLYTEMSDGTLVSPPGCEWQDALPPPCPHCRESGEIHTIITACRPARIDGGEPAGYDDSRD